MANNATARVISAHGDKLRALLKNTKLPVENKPLVEETIKRYEEWIESLKVVEGDYNKRLEKMVQLFNDYKFHVEFNLIYDNPSNFLYRQKGQLKLDNTVIEEFLPYLVRSMIFNEFKDLDLTFGPATCFSSLHFESSILSDEPGAGMKLHQKDQDFVISRTVFIKASRNSEFKDSVKEKTNVAYLAAECKTNLDKTMFQEASATALDLKKSVPSAKYFLLCEWLDMTPISTGTTAIDEIIILRKAKRISSNTRAEFSTYAGRKKNKDMYKAYLKENPFVANTFDRFLSNIKQIIKDNSEEEVLDRGHF